MRIKTRLFFGTLVGLALVLGLVPGMSMTAYAGTTVSNLWIGSSSEITTTGDVGNVGQTSGTINVSINNDSIVLDLDNFNFNAEVHKYSYCSAAIIYNGDAPLTIKLTGTNTITTTSSSDDNNYGIYCDKAVLNIEGPGSLTITSGDSGFNTCAMVTNNTLTISNCSVNATAGTSNYDYAANVGIKAGGEVSIEFADVTATGGTATGMYGKSYGIQAISLNTGPRNVIIKAGKLTISGNDSALYYANSDYNTKILLAAGSTLSLIKAGENSSSAVDTTIGSITNQKYINLEASAPHHDFTYSADGATITATCGVVGCNLTANLTIAVPQHTTYGDGQEEAATLTGHADFNTTTGLTVEKTAIKYYKATKGEGGVYTRGDEITDGAPTGAGDYMAEITLSDVKTGAETTGNVTASVGYTIAPITIDSVEVTGISTPVATEALDTEAATDTQNVTLKDSGAITWDPAAPQDGKAAYATAYKATVTAVAVENYGFADVVTATVNGQTATVTKNQDGTLAISYTFEKTALMPVTITPADKETAYSADGIAVPLEGMFTITEGAGATICSVENGTGEGTYNAQPGKLSVTKCGTFTVKVSTVATGTHLAGAETSATLTVGRADISKAKVTLAKSSYAYDGKAKEPKATVTLGGRALKVGKDFSVSYKNNVKVGTATATVKGKGNYQGTAKTTFKIALAKVRGLSTAAHAAKGTLDASWNAVAGAASYQLSWRKAGGSWKSRTVKGTSAAIKGLEAGSCYEVRVRAKAGSTTGAWSKVAGRWLKKASSLKAVAGKSKGTIKVSWAADEAATGGYVAYACEAKDGKVLAKKSVAAGKTSATLTGLVSGRAYYVKVRPLREVSGTTYVGVVRYCKATVKAK